ncbi:helix-turn-helix domain-containing protein [Candidatus Ventrimonas sp.]|uniref:helix-turn-helix domain-containing protein n=1 Tax=Candidatus Ventrimonas sp. TaxID=3048889 RepID=UPI003AB84936
MIRSIKATVMIGAITNTTAHVIARHNGKLSEAAQALEIHRTTLYRRQKAAEK